MHSRHLLIIALCFLFFACSGEKSTSEVPVQASFEDKAGVQDFYESWKPSQAERERGYQLFRNSASWQSCAQCHTDRKGETRTTGPNLADVSTVFSAKYGSLASARTWLHNKILAPKDFLGVNHQGYATEMPTFSGKIPDQDIKAIVAHLTGGE